MPKLNPDVSWPVVGHTYSFDYPEEFTTLPTYSAHRGHSVKVLEELPESEADYIVDEGLIVDKMYRIQANDGWIGSAWASELC